MPRDATSFDPAVMGWLYEVGREQARLGKDWRTTPPGTRPGEEVPVRGGTRLKSIPKSQRPHVLAESEKFLEARHGDRPTER